MVLTLSGQLWAARERLAALESLLIRKGAIATGEVESHDFTDAEELELAALRKELLASLFGILEVQVPVPSAQQPATRAEKGTGRAARASKAGASKTGRKTRRSRRKS